MAWGLTYCHNSTGWIACGGLS